ncbi:MAG: hypothetical protein R6X29_04080 [Acidimicrobiia bacterium]|jgi:hypothetical protein
MLEVPLDVHAAVQVWDRLSRWERAEAGRRLRRLGWSYGEIMSILPVAKGTLAGWCREIRLSQEQCRAIAWRAGGQLGVPRDTQRKRRAEVEQIRAKARSEVPSLLAEPLWVAGTVLYWAEGSKTTRMVELTNADPDALRLFMSWARRYHDRGARFRANLNLHADNDENAAIAWWCERLGLVPGDFTKTFIKPDGTGHRKNHLVQGVCRVRMRRSGDAWHRTMGWLEALPGQLGLEPSW